MLDTGAAVGLTAAQSAKGSMSCRSVCSPARTLIRRYEQCRLTAYPDGGGVWSIGWGHTGKEVHQGLVWTQELAESVFELDLAQFGVYVAHFFPDSTLNDNQFGALVSLAYNCGLVIVRQLYERWKAQRLDAFYYNWSEHNRDAKGQIENGLVKRRQDEIALFKTV